MNQSFNHSIHQSLNSSIRTGIGIDFHRFTAGRPLVIGGVEIRYEKGLLGHSDADVLVHALCDALLGAAGLGDIGTHFPDTDPQYRGISSLTLLERVMAMVREAGFRPVNSDCVLIAQVPKLVPHFPGMKSVLSPILGLPPDRIGLKATTSEGMGAIGRGEGINAVCTCLIERA